MKTQKVMSQISENFIAELSIELRYQCPFLLFLIFRSVIRINIRIGGKKTEILNLFFNLFLICQITTSAGPLTNK